MGYLSGLKRKVLALDFGEAAKDAVADKEELITELVRDQLRHGQTADSVDSSGYDLGTLLSQEYADNKFRNGARLAPYGAKDLYDKGSFSRRITTSIVGDEIITESTDPKADKVLAVEQEYSDVSPEQVYGMNKKSRKTFTEAMRPEFIAHIAKQLK